jgi:hypothetical protein
MANSVTLATRVGIDMRAMANQFVSADETANVNAYASRPVLQIKKKDSSPWLFTLTFADALTRSEPGMREDHLKEAYRRAVSSFEGQLQQHFLVFTEVYPCPKVEKV